MPINSRSCPDCATVSGVSRREFLAAGAAAVAVSALPSWAAAEEAAARPEPESLVKSFYDSLSEEQRKAICYDWDYVKNFGSDREPRMGLLRTRVSNNWHINDVVINTDFYTSDQKEIIKAIFEGIIQPDWHKRIYKQLEDDAGGYGESQNVALFGKPGDGKFEFVMTGRHMTLRCDGNSTESVAFGGPIFYGHAASGFNETLGHPGNIFWPQALEANKVYEMLDGKQRQLAVVEKLPEESHVGFRGPDGELPGIRISELSSDQLEQTQKVLAALLEPYRQIDRDEVAACLKAQGGLEHCSLAFYREGDLGNDSQWDCWRLEGPSFVWYFRGTPHVHVWANIASDPAVKLNA